MDFFFSKLLYACFGLSTIVRPSGILNLAKYLDKIKEIDINLIRYNFYKEMSLYIMGFFCCFGNYISRHYLNFSHKNFFIDVGVSLPFAYAVSKMAALFVEKKEIKYFNANIAYRADEIKNILKSHSPNLEQFVLVSSTTVFLMMFFIELSEHYFSKDDVAVAFGLLGCLLGYITGQMLYDGSCCLFSMCYNVNFFSTTTQKNQNLLKELLIPLKICKPQQIPSINRLSCNSNPFAQ